MAMVMVVSRSYFKAHALELLRRVEATGEPLMLSDRGRPVLELWPYRGEDSRERIRGSLLAYQLDDGPTGEPWEAQE